MPLNSSVPFSGGSWAGGCKVDLDSSARKSCGRAQRARSRRQTGCVRARANRRTRAENIDLRERRARTWNHGGAGISDAEFFIGEDLADCMVSSVVLP
jgi:hypothetical protein